MEWLSLSGKSGIESNPSGLIIATFFIFSYTSVSLIFLSFYWRYQAKIATSEHAKNVFYGLQWITIFSNVVLVILPSVMLFVSVWSLRLLGVLALGTYIYFFLGRLRKVKIEPGVVEEIIEKIKPVPVEEKPDTFFDLLRKTQEQVAKLDTMITKLRGKDDDAGSH